jgi:SAM-dependent methyltransferase
MEQPVACAFVDPGTAKPLRRRGEALVGEDGAQYPIIAGIPRFCPIDNYSDSFGQQWSVALPISSTRLFRETGWLPAELAGLDILEVGSGAGRFSRVLLEETRVNLFSVDYSSAVEANWRNNSGLGAGRFHLAQASIYEMPFPDARFDKVLCLGVLQHTPDFEESVRALVRKARPGGEIVVDFYPIRGWWTKLHAKYLLRPLTRRMKRDQLLRMIERNVDWMMELSKGLERAGLGIFRRFLPIVDFMNAMPSGLTPEQLREWVVLDTFDMFSPEHDHPQRLWRVASMFERAGAVVNFAAFVDCGSGEAAVVRAVRR